MKTITKDMTIYLTAKDWLGEGNYDYDIQFSDMSEYGYIFVAKKEIEFSMEVPEGFDPVNGHIDALKAEKQRIAGEAQIKMNNLEEQIQSLLAIECDS